MHPLRTICVTLVSLLIGASSGCVTPDPCGGQAVSNVDPCLEPRTLAGLRQQLEQLLLRHPDGTIAAKGHGIAGGALFDPRYWEATVEGSTIPVRSGLWHYYYPSGQQQAVVQTRLAVGVWCGAIPFFAPYDVKEGAFRFYHPNGALLAEGEFELTEVHRENMCEGGVEIEAGAVPRATVFYDSTEATISDPGRLAELREMVERW